MAALTLADAPVYSEYDDNVPALVGTMHPHHHHDSTPEHPAESAGTHHDPFLPNFATFPPVGNGSLVASQAGGTWSSLFPHVGSDDIIQIRHHVVLDGVADVHTVVIEQGGRLEFATTGELSLRVVNLQVLGGGELVIGTADAPITGQAEVVFKDVPLDLHRDPGQYGNGLIAQGVVRMHGRTLEETFVRLGEEGKAGDSRLQVNGDLAGWQAGDRILMPDTRQIFYTDHTSKKLNRYEQPQIASIDSDGIQLNTPLMHDHLGARDADGQLAFVPHVANLSRNVVLRSENPAGTRGHTMFMRRADVDIRYVGFEDLGRTTNHSIDDTVFSEWGEPLHIGENQRGRYPLHMHHLIGPLGGQETGYQSTFIGNSIHTTENSQQFQWGMVLHGAHYSLVADNVVYNYAGSGIVTEDGSESFNRISGNFISRIDGTRGRGKFTDGREGSGIWLRRPNNYVVDNVVTGAEKSAFAIYGGENTRARDVRVPAYPGADPHGDDHIYMSPENMHLLQFDGNEAYASHMGLELWYLGYQTYTTPTTKPLEYSVVNDLHLWHINQTGVFGEQAHKLKMNNAVIIGDRSALSRYNVPNGIRLERVTDVTIANATVQNLDIGIQAPVRTGALGREQLIHEIQPFVIDGGLLLNKSNIAIKTPSEDVSADAPPRYVLIRDVRFSQDPNDAGTARNITMSYGGGRFANVVQQDVVEVERFNGQAGADFRLFYEQQRPDFVVPQTGSRPETGPNSPIGAPVAGLTNAEAWQQYGIAVGGAVAPGDASSENRLQFPGVNGLAFPLADHMLPPVITSIAPDSGQQDDFVTHRDRLIIRGVSRAGSSITLYHDGVSIGTASADSRGNWKFDHRDTQLSRGSHTFSATSTWEGVASSLSDTITVQVFNQAPSVNAAEFSVLENVPVGHVLGTIAGSDSDLGDSVRLTIVSGNQGGLFRLDPDSGQLSVARRLDESIMRGSYDLAVRATDRAGLTAETIVQVNILARVPGEWVTDVKYQDFPQLSPAEIAFLRPEQVATIPNSTWFLRIPAESRAALTGEQVRGLNTRPVGMIGGLTAAQILELSDEQVRSIGGDDYYAYLDFSRLPAERIIALSAAQLNSIPTRDGLLRIPAAARAALTGDQVRALDVRPTGMIDGLTDSQILELTIEQVQSLGSKNLGFLDFRRLPPTLITALTRNQLESIPSEQEFMRISAASRLRLAEVGVTWVRGVGIVFN